MPVANNRQSVRLTPVDTTFADWDYLKAQPPACSALEASLAVFALFILLCLFVQLIIWRTRLSLDRARTSNTVSALALQGSSKHILGPRSGLLKERHLDSLATAMSEQVTFTKEKTDVAHPSKLAVSPQWAKMIERSPHAVIARPPPAPPLTPPEMSSAVYTFETAPSDPRSFMHQPNPDYMSSTADLALDTAASGSTSTTRRRSYNKTIPIGIPAPQDSAASQTANFIHPPSSYPPSSLQLPPPPPTSRRTGSDGKLRREIEVQGEIISRLDDEGAGWTRHTRVYGGGACLACAASGGSHEGGFYGANVSREEMW